MKLELVPLTKLVIGENLSRAGVEPTEKSIRELADCIEENNDWDPPDATKRDGVYHLEAGFRRIAAAQLLIEQNRLPEGAGKKQSVYLLVRELRTEKDGDIRNALENISREDLNSYQTAHTLADIQTRHNYTNGQLAALSRLDIKSVGNYIRLTHKLTPRIKAAWLNYEGTEKAIPLLRLLAWASKEPDEQERQYDNSVWGTTFVPHSQPKRLRRRETIEKRLETETNLEVIKVLQWVLGEDNGRKHSSDNRRISGNGAVARRSVGARISDGSSRSVRKDEKRGHVRETDDSPITSRSR